MNLATSEDVVRVRQVVRILMVEMKFSLVDQTKMVTATSELARNTVQHGGGGDLILRVLRDADMSGIEALSLDKGPGIRNMGESLRDNYSTSGSPGTGFGAIMRLSSLFDIYSRPGQGTVVLSRIWREPPASAPTRPLEVGVVCLPVATEDVCGDAWALHQTRERALIMLADGLGHGQYAAEASAEAVKVFESYATNSGPAQMIERMHAAMRITRGAAVAVTEVLWDQRVVRYAGAGNISGRIYSGDAFHSMVSHNGTVGVEAHKIVETTYPWPENGMLVLHSDGLGTHWKLDDYPGLRGRSPAVIAGVLFRDHNRVKDDSTVVVMRETKGAL